MCFKYAVMKKLSKNIQTVIDILRDEVRGDVVSALQKMTDDYTMTWVDMGYDGRQLFRRTGDNIHTEMEEVYAIKGREYDIKNIVEGDRVVMVELIESYSNPVTHKTDRTPLVLVLEMKDGKIRTGRHYLDPRISQQYLTKEEIEKAYKNSTGSILIIK